MKVTRLLRTRRQLGFTFQEAGAECSLSAAFELSDPDKRLSKGGKQ
jgi:hypothetical protein